MVDPNPVLSLGVNLGDLPKDVEEIRNAVDNSKLGTLDLQQTLGSVAADLHTTATNTTYISNTLGTVNSTVSDTKTRLGSVDFGKVANDASAASVNTAAINSTVQSVKTAVDATKQQLGGVALDANTASANTTSIRATLGGVVFGELAADAKRASDNSAAIIDTLVEVKESIKDLRRQICQLWLLDQCIDHLKGHERNSIVALLNHSLGDQKKLEDCNGEELDKAARDNKVHPLLHLNANDYDEVLECARSAHASGHPQARTRRST
jgi:hypothetical protein